jgi:transglutaminase-like putative cysteine protease
VQDLLPRPRPALATAAPPTVGAAWATTSSASWGAEPLAVDATELAAASLVTYRIRQRLRYTYDGPARGLVHRLVVLPPNRHGDQISRHGELTVSAPAARVSWERGPDGLRAATVTLDEVPGVLDFDAAAIVERGPATTWPALPASTLTGRRLLAPTPLTAPDDTLLAVASRLTGPDPLTTARRCCAWVFENIAYRPGSTTVGTTAAQAVVGGAGVCQDQAHVMIALCRAAGLPARYVLGHLVGDGESHAWVEVVLPEGWAPPPPGRSRGPAGPGTPGGAGAAAVALDPCHNRLADRRYLTIATGRDYHDVMPTSGVYRGSGRGLLAASQRVEIVGLAG